MPAKFFSVTKITQFDQLYHVQYDGWMAICKVWVIICDSVL